MEANNLICYVGMKGFELIFHSTGVHQIILKELHLKISNFITLWQIYILRSLVYQVYIPYIFPSSLVIADKYLSLENIILISLNKYPLGYVYSLA